MVPIGLGNFILATPAMELLHSHFGNSLYILALKPGIQEMAIKTKWFEKVFYWDPDRESKLKGWKVIQEIRKEGIQQSISLFPSSHWKFSLFSLISGVKFRAGFRYPSAKITNWIQSYSQPLAKIHDVYQNLSLVEHLIQKKLASPAQLCFPLPGSPEIEKEVSPLNYFVCHPGSSLPRGMEKKRLLPEKFAQCIEMIYKTFKIKCVLVGGPEEQLLRDQIKNYFPDCFIDVKSESLSDTGSLIHYSKFFLGNDSGMMHISVAKNKPCIAFFGPSDEGRTGPFPQSNLNHLVLRNKTGSHKLEGISNRSPRQMYRESGGLDTLNIQDRWGEIKDFLIQLLQ